MFVPDGLLTVWQARHRLGRAVFGNQWDRCPTQSEEAALYSQIRGLREGLTLARKRELWPHVQVGLSPIEKRRRRQLELDDDAAMRRFVRLADADLKAIDDEISARFAEPLAREQRCGEAKVRLRAALHSGAVPATLLTVHGTEHRVPREFWASEQAETALDTGEASYHPGVYRAPGASQLEGRIFLPDAEIAAALQGLTRCPDGSASVEAEASLPPTVVESVEAKPSPPRSLRDWFDRDDNVLLSERKGWPKAKEYLGRDISRELFRRMWRAERNARDLPLVTGRPQRR